MKNKLENSMNVLAVDALVAVALPYRLSIMKKRQDGKKYKYHLTY